MSGLKPRETQQKVKHQILTRYLKAWGGIIGSGLKSHYDQSVRRKTSFRASFVYVDCFSYQGRYANEDDKPVFGSPIIGIRALDDLKKATLKNSGFSPETRTILIEENVTEYKGLLNTLELAGYGSRLKNSDNFDLLKEGEIAVIHGNSLDYADKLIEFTGRKYTWSFYDLDPYGPSGIPMSFVSKIVSQDRTDAMINLPYLDLHRKTGPAARNDLNLELNMKPHDAMYGSQAWRKIATYYYDVDGKVIDSQKLEADLVNEYRSVLLRQDSGLVVKRIPLEFPNRDRTLYYLFLTTHDATGALELNKILNEAEFSQLILKEERRITKGGTQQPLFDLMEINGKTISNTDAEEVDFDLLANRIYHLFKNRTVSYRKILQQMADTLYFPEDIQQALRRLKQNGLASFRSTKHDDPIQFN